MNSTIQKSEQRYRTCDMLLLVDMPKEFLTEVLDPLLRLTTSARARAATEILTKKTLYGRALSPKVIQSIHFFGNFIPYTGNNCLWSYLHGCTPAEARGLFLFDCTIDSRDYFTEEDQITISYNGFSRVLPYSYTYRLSWFNNTYFRERAIKEFFKDSLIMANPARHEKLYIGSGLKGSDFYFNDIGVEHKFVSGPISKIKHPHDAKYIIGYLSLADKFVMIDCTGPTPRWMRDETTKKEDFPLTGLTAYFKNNYAKWLIAES